MYYYIKREISLYQWRFYEKDGSKGTGIPQTDEKCNQKYIIQTIDNKFN